MDPESRIKELGLELPPSVPPGGVYKVVVASLLSIWLTLWMLITYPDLNKRIAT